MTVTYFDTPPFGEHRRRGYFSTVRLFVREQVAAFEGLGVSGCGACCEALQPASWSGDTGLRRGGYGAPRSGLKQGCSGKGAPLFKALLPTYFGRYSRPLLADIYRTSSRVIRSHFSGLFPRPSTLAVAGDPTPGFRPLSRPISHAADALVPVLQEPGLVSMPRLPRASGSRPHGGYAVSSQRRLGRGRGGLAAGAVTGL